MRQPDLDTQWAAEKASFCLELGIAPSEYDRLTLIERDEFIRAHNKRVEAKNAAQRRR